MICVWQIGEQKEYYEKNNEYEIEYFIKSYKMQWWTGIATYFQLFFAQPAFFFIKKEMFMPVERRVKKVLKCAILIEVLLYGGFGAAGYLSLGDKNIVDLIVLRMPIGDTDICMTIAFFAAFTLVFLAALMNFFPCREMFMDFFGIQRNFKTRFITTISLFTIAISVVIIYPSVMVVMGLVGGLLCSFVGWDVPLMIRIQMLKDEKWYSLPKLWYVLLLVFTLFIACISTLQSLANFKF